MNKILLALILVMGVSTIAEAGKGRQPCSGKKGVKTTAGIPKTGLSYSKFSNYENKNRVVTKTDKKNGSIGFGSLLLIGIVGLFLYLVFFG